MSNSFGAFCKQKYYFFYFVKRSSLPQICGALNRVTEWFPAFAIFLDKLFQRRQNHPTIAVARFDLFQRLTRDARWYWYFQTKNINFDKFWKALVRKIWVEFMPICCIFMCICLCLWSFRNFVIFGYIFSPFWCVAAKKSGNPALHYNCSNDNNRAIKRCDRSRVMLHFLAEKNGARPRKPQSAGLSVAWTAIVVKIQLCT
jgi:hypothetical protein